MNPADDDANSLNEFDENEGPKEMDDKHFCYTSSYKSRRDD